MSRTVRHLKKENPEAREFALRGLLLREQDSNPAKERRDFVPIRYVGTQPAALLPIFQIHYASFWKALMLREQDSNQ